LCSTGERERERDLPSESAWRVLRRVARSRAPDVVPRTIPVPVASPQLTSRVIVRGRPPRVSLGVCPYAAWLLLAGRALLYCWHGVPSRPSLPSRPLRHLLACAGVHPAWRTVPSLLGMWVTVEALVLRSPLVLYAWLGRGLVMSCLVVPSWLNSVGSVLSSCRFGRQGAGRPIRLAGLLGGDLVTHPASLACSAETWSFAPPRRLARRGLGRLPRLAGLLGGDLVARPASLARSAGTWSFAPPRRLARRGLGCSPRLAVLLGKWAGKRLWASPLGTLFLGTRQHPSTIFTGQDAAMAGAVAYVFPNTSHRLCIWHIYLNATKHLRHVIHKFPKKFLPEFKKCVYEDRSEDYFKKKWNELFIEYGLQDNSWMQNLYNLRAKWTAVYRDSFMADMTSTQRSEGMNNVFKKRFRRKLGLSELLAECDKVSSTLRENELDFDFKSRVKNPVNYVQNLPMLKTAAESYTKRIYKEFEEEFKMQLSYSCTLLRTEGSISTFMVTHMYSHYGATVKFNTADMTIACSCRKYESIGMYTYFNLQNRS
jgi:hypothetical protein